MLKVWQFWWEVKKMGNHQLRVSNGEENGKQRSAAGRA